MKDQTREHLSCLMDGELSQETSRFMARRLGSDQTLGETWERYHLIRACLRQPGEQRALVAIRLDYERDHDRAADEGRLAQPAIAAGAAQSGNHLRWLRPLGGAAIAASVAALAVLVAAAYGPTPVPSTIPDSQPFTSPNPRGVVPLSQPASFAPRPASRQRMNTYLLRHNLAAGQVGRQGFVSQMPLSSATAVQVLEPETMPPAEQETGENPRTAGDGGGSDSP